MPMETVSCHAVPMLRCLLVDDSPRFLAAARGLLERQGIAVVGMASSGAEALEQARQRRPDVVLVDIDLGGESGFELAGRLHRDPRSAPSRVILISTHAEEDYADLIEASPVVGFLSKASLSGAAVPELLDPRRGQAAGDAVNGPRRS
jgi:CheY-like chemotaxis protein